MATSPEHQFIAEELYSVLNYYANTKLLGVLEADRKKYDYACVLERDCERPLVSQVLWSHTEGVHKDLMMLLHDQHAVLKVYFAKDTTKHRLKIDEVISEYQNNDSTRHLLRGLKIIFLPAEFDADKPNEQRLMSNYMSQIICRDLLFGTAFGRLTRFDVRVFANHGGPLGLKYAVLDEITKNGLIHNPSFKRKLDYNSDGPLREITATLSASGLVRRIDRSNVLLPTIKGRMFMDLTRRLLYEQSNSEHSPGDLGLIKEILFGAGEREHFNTYQELMDSANYCRRQFGRDLLENIDASNPSFYSKFHWEDFYEQLKSIPGFSKTIFEEPDCDFGIEQSF